MELCGLNSSSNGHTHAQEWHHEASAGYLPQKRKRSDVLNMTGDRSECADAFPAKETHRNSSSFVRLDGQKGVYYSERWEPNGSTLYLPVRDTVLANVHRYEQLSFEHGCFCIGDHAGGFLQRVQGQALHCWRYSEAERKLFIALSYFFTNCETCCDFFSSCTICLISHSNSSNRSALTSPQSLAQSSVTQTEISEGSQTAQTSRNPVQNTHTVIFVQQPQAEAETL
ncbi:hypothetical protein Baya_9896 [Bagarius yarrelli]|uniref:Uncharacterized protein n=1 Tax=Bagarius yarrelli TaxID=175774 RepID=A0A556U8X9_BAGYA|nr:hypothetical protein Baya_9896 [Bagarius yarrelli]